MNLRKATVYAAIVAALSMHTAAAHESHPAPPSPAAAALAECMAQLGAACPLATPSLQGITGSARLWLQGITGSAGPTLQGITGSARPPR